ncbi:cytosolic protein [Bacillus sp. JCM 19046]|uniref:Uncharacterized protein (TIGR00369 family) n=1 Tax=Shouchella xiaoxiensis TaxID=766895 RepID=A0ABS2SX20_9BACI|nr:PaaI family thioesterase [Shouchella xiaoxiensis]MBM7840083.1 uncharacterized protein (TIGR00369 family) [Shouchella xiaoxiensis]GAF12555.1 cytosolic protein [Bacillus sp. JCM 19045]GAF18158.1 cytosolic protein [Bacillus sp. JCM 19046]
MSHPLMDVISLGKQPPPCDSLIKIEMNQVSEGIAEAVWTPDEQMLNGNGVIMGGFISSAADVVIAYAISSLVNEKQTFASVNLTTTFHRPALPGQINVTAIVKKFGKTMSYVTAELMQNGKLVASAASSVLVQEVND